ncbi:uncharacterized protein BX664DRAFT_340815 [Halteromyces radiatus]|uniref:uncharacterized protein n=1 Tax=Halteromyces radiatus TaxID=101107 RepID=UPI00221F1D1A|nr:uncharacterized protein BX664DRAFT_340815 [Halteromyces radiatus]KAI8081609.1 hypothetical protein BX664DRAFT_340815 [Halteromyces radiatus]
MDYLQLLKNGERITLDIPTYAITFAMPAGALALLVVMPSLPGVVKQILAIPLLIANLLYPMLFTSHPMLDLVGSPFNFTVNLRFLELLYVGPWLQNRPVYTTIYSLWVDFWSCLRTFPKPAKETTKDIKKGEIKVYKKDKKFYHILVRLMFCLVCVDILGAWFATYSMYDIIALQQDRPVFFFIFFLLAGLFITAGFNAGGYGLHLFYCIVVENGSYSSEQYRILMDHPILSPSLDEVWSYRWHQLFKSSWLAFPFRPTRLLTQRILAKRTKNYVGVSILMASISVFIISGLMHEYMILCNVGWPVYRDVFVGQQTFFFTIHGIGVIFERVVRTIAKNTLPSSIYNSMAIRVLQHIWVLTFGVAFFTYFMEGFSYWGVYNGQPFQFSRPIIYQYVKSHPALQPYFGSVY